MKFHTLLVDDSRSFWQRAFKPFAFFAGMRFTQNSDDQDFYLADDLLPPVRLMRGKEGELSSKGLLLKGYLLLLPKKQDSTERLAVVKHDVGDDHPSQEGKKGVLVHIEIKASPLYPSKIVFFSDPNQKFLCEKKTSDDVKSLVVHIQPGQCFQIRIGTYLYGDFECRGDTLVEITPWTYKLLNFLGL